MKESIKKIIPNTLIKMYRVLKYDIRSIPDDEKVEMNMQTIVNGHHQVTYRGIKAIRCPFDYVMYQMILSEIKPDLVIEIGTNTGGGALYIADLMETLGHGILHTIDIVPQSDKTLATHPRIKLFTKGFENYDLKETLSYKKILVIDDGSHMYEDVIASLKKFSPIVSKGSYFIVEDGIVSEQGREAGFNGGPLRAIREFMTDNNTYIVDRTYCDMFGKNATFNINGYLKRIQ
jgi:cephalosporin hydroxylase